VGVIGDLDCSWPIKEEEKKVLSVAVRVQKITGIAILIHSVQHPDSPFEILDILVAVVEQSDHTIMSHLERTLLNYEYMEKFAKTRCYMEFNAFGKEEYFLAATKTDLSVDIQMNTTELI